MQCKNKCDDDWKVCLACQQEKKNVRDHQTRALFFILFFFIFFPSYLRNTRCYGNNEVGDWLVKSGKANQSTACMIPCLCSSTRGFQMRRMPASSFVNVHLSQY